MKLDDKEIDRLNNYLARDYGYFNGELPNWRIVWSDDQVEKRLSKFTDFGVELVDPVVMEKPKYRQYIHQKYILERLIPIPPRLDNDLVGKFSYEPIFVFADKDDNFLPPRYDVCKIVIYGVYHKAAASVGVQYRDPRAEEDFREMELARMESLKEYLWGNETPVTDALAADSAVGYTGKETVN
jgi:hypothetical protein